MVGLQFKVNILIVYSMNMMDIHVSPSLTLTELCTLMGKHGSDKGGVYNPPYPRHCYTKYYYELFSPIKHNHLRIFELGIGSTNNYPYNMGANGRPGGSLRGWREFFPNAHIYSADIDRSILVNEERIQTFYCDQGSKESILDMWNNPALQEEFDIIIDDGCHEVFHNVTFFENSFHKLKKGGIYIIEDTIRPQEATWLDKINYWEKQYPDSKFRYVRIDNPLYEEDILIVVQKL